MTHRKLAVVFAAVVFAGGASTALAQRGGGAPSPGIGAGGTGFAPTPGIGTGGMPGTAITPTPGIGTGAPPIITPTPGIGTTPNPPGTLTGGPPSSGPPGEKPEGEKPPSGGRLAPWRTSMRKPRHISPTNPANVRFPNGQQMCLGFPAGPGRPYHTPRQR